jgi:iron complex transport system substrate-binding protein
MLFAVGAGDRVVGVTTFCRFPEEAKRLPKIGTYTEPNYEAILSLRPELVIIQENPIEMAAKLQQMGVRVLELKHTTVEDIFISLEKIGQATGAAERAKTVAQSIRSNLEAIRTRAAKLPATSLLFIVGRTPNALEGLIAVGKASYLGELLAIAGGRNILGDAVSAYPKVSFEEILARNPEVIIDMGEMANTVGVTEADKRRVRELWSRYNGLRAVKSNRVHAVASDIYVVPGPRMVQAAREFARLLHPEAGF